MRAIIRTLCCVGISLSIVSCAALSDPREETWQAAHLVDAAQTFRIAQDPACYGEMGSAALIGHHPNEASVAAWSVGEAAVHAGIAEWLITRNHPRLAWAFELVTIGQVGYAIDHNYGIGIRIGAANVSACDHPRPARAAEPAGPAVG